MVTKTMTKMILVTMNRTHSRARRKKRSKQAVADDSHVAKGKLLAKGLEFGHRSSVTVAGLITVDVQLSTKTDPGDDKLDVTNIDTAETTGSDTELTNPSSNKIKLPGRKRTLGSH